MKKLFTLFVLLITCLIVRAQTTATIDGIKYTLNSDGTAEVASYQSTSLEGAVSIPANVVSDGKNYKVTALADHAFQACDKITSMTVSEGIKSFGEKAFYNCFAMQTCIIPDGVISLGDNCFENCSALQSIKTPASIRYAGDAVFRRCKNLVKAEINGSFTNMDHWFYHCEKLRTVTIPSSVTNMAATFYHCTGLTRAPEIPSSVTNMAATFFHCTGLTRAPEIPSSVTNMQHAFSYCTSLTTAPKIPSSVTNLESAFSYCTSLTTAPKIPSSVTELQSAFAYCTSLTTAPEIPSSVTNLQSAFSGCTSLTTAPKIPSSLTWMKWTFSGCTSLNIAPEIPSSVTNMDHAFQGCTNLTTVPLIPSSVTSMQYTFYGCMFLSSVTCNWQSREELYDSIRDEFVFDYLTFDSDLSNACLYVPAGTVNIYKSTSPWSSFGHIVEQGGPAIQKCATPTISYADKKLSYDCTTEGATFKYNVTCADVKSGTGTEQSLAAAYNITAQASADGYLTSDLATATLYWVNGTLDPTDVNAVSANARGILVQSDGDFLTVSGLNTDEPVSLYNVAGQQLGTTRSVNGTATFSANKTDQVVIVKIGKEALKVKL